MSKNNRKKGIRKKPAPKRQGNSPIQRTDPPKRGISFSFKYFRADHPVFYAPKDPKYLNALLKRLQGLSTYSRNELMAMSGREKTLRFHPIDWSDTRFNAFGIPEEDALVEQPFQFSISRDKYGRVHGFFISDVFYVVWVDPKHRLYS